MTRRAAANEETRKRIVDAAIALHAEKGVLGTSWPTLRSALMSRSARYTGTFPALINWCRRVPPRMRSARGLPDPAFSLD